MDKTKYCELVRKSRAVVNEKAFVWMITLKHDKKCDDKPSPTNRAFSNGFSKGFS